ncbi:hypothetical protein M8J75_015877 [Diaphorina citri]|nr:hypothetical protein M8J75_015877 [Diaphorina citri]
MSAHQHFRVRGGGGSGGEDFGEGGVPGSEDGGGGEGGGSGGENFGEGGVPGSEDGWGGERGGVAKGGGRLVGEGGELRSRKLRRSKKKEKKRS